MSPPASPTVLIRFGLTGADAADELVELVRESVTAVAPAVLHSRVRAIIDVDASTAVRTLGVPAVHVVGSRDRVLGAAARRGLSTLNPSIRTVEIEGPHLLAQTRPEVVAREVLRLNRERPTTP